MATQVCSYTLAGMAAWACFGVDLFSSEKVRPQYEGRPQYDSDEDDVSGALSPHGGSGKGKTAHWSSIATQCASRAPPPPISTPPSVFERPMGTNDSRDCI